MPIKNYTTEVPAAKSILEIQTALSKHGARRIEVNYDIGGEPESLFFIIRVKEQGQDKEIPFHLPVNIKALERILDKKRDPNYRQYDSNYQRQHLERLHAQAVRVGWRIVKDWIAAQMAYIETTMVSLDQVFLPYLQVKGDQTLFEVMNSRGLLTERKD